jgi:hypothetical protein
VLAAARWTATFSAHKIPQTEMMMVPLLSLWLPIALSAVGVFIVSSVMHMVIGHHKNDHARVDSEDAVMNALRPFNIPPGDYFMPRPAGMKDLKSPEFLEKRAKGPVIIATVLPSGTPSMVPSLVQWMVYSLVVGVFAAYIAGRALAPHAAAMEVVRYSGTVAFAGYSLALFQDSIWYSRKWSTTLKYGFDGLVYALLTGATFAWLWPK